MKRTPHASPESLGFSLLELLTVIAVLAILSALIVPSVGRIATGTRLTQDGSRLVDEINTARALALARNQPVEIWFLQLPASSDGSDIGWRGIRCRMLESDGTATWVSRTQKLSESMLLASSEALSNCIGGQNSQPLTDLPGSVRGTGIRFYPGGRVEPISPLGSLSLNDPLFVTIAHAQDLAGSTSELPRNFITIQVEPRNGRVTSFRP